VPRSGARKEKRYPSRAGAFKRCADFFPTRFYDFPSPERGSQEVKSESIGQAPRAAQGLQNIAPVEAPCAFLIKISLSSRRGAFFEVSNTPGVGPNDAPVEARCVFLRSGVAQEHLEESPK